MKTRRIYVAVVRKIGTQEPAAIFTGEAFERIDRILGLSVIEGTGRCYTCLLHGEKIHLWQMYDIDHWYIEVPAEPHEGKGPAPHRLSTPPHRF